MSTTPHRDKALINAYMAHFQAVVHPREADGGIEGLRGLATTFVERAREYFEGQFEDQLYEHRLSYETQIEDLNTIIEDLEVTICDLEGQLEDSGLNHSW